MLDIKFIKENTKAVKENLKKRYKTDKIKLVDELLKHYESWLNLKHKVEELRHRRNVASQEINKLQKQRKNISAKVKEIKKIPVEIVSLEDKQKKLQEKINKILLEIPNMLHKSVPIGKDESKNVEIKKIGKPNVPSYKIFNHGELAEKLGGADFETARKISGKGFYFLLGSLAELSMAIINYSRDYMIKKGFKYVEPPLMIRKKIVDGVMSFEEMNNMIYKIDGEDLYLIGTAEHPLIGMFSGKKLEGKNIPYKITGFSPCFRKEIGSHGVDEKGFYRLHQFNKQEMVVVCDPKDSYKWFDKMLNYTVDIFTSLDIPIRIIECCSGDLADLKSKSCDVEAWSPKQKKYFEAGSLSNLEEAQARRLNIKIEKNGKKYFAHILNNTVIAVPRAIRFLMENNQQKDGSIKIPKVLQKYMNGLKKIE